MQGNLGIIGVGKLGLAYALVFESQGWNILASSYKADYVEELLQKKTNSTEPRLPEMLASSVNINFTVDNHAVLDHSDMWYVMVATPSNADGSYDVSSVDAVCEDILDHQGDLNGKILLVGCTVNPGDCDRFQKIVEPKGVKVAYCPTFISQGSVIYEIENPVGITVGTPDIDVYHKVRQTFQTINPNLSDNLIYMCKRETGEILKLAGNCYSILHISFFNMLGQLLIERGLETELELSSQIINNVKANYQWRFGFGYGGPCYPRDNRSMVHFAESVGRQYPLGQVCDDFNKNHAYYLVDLLIKQNTEQKPFYFKYLSYKPGVMIYEESHPFDICKILLQKGYTVKVQENKHVDRKCISVLQSEFGNNIALVTGDSDDYFTVLPSVVRNVGLKYAIKVPFGDFGGDDWLFVTKEGPDGPEIVLYNNMQDALDQRAKWGGNAVVVEYDDK